VYDEILFPHFSIVRASHPRHPPNVKNAFMNDRFCPQDPGLLIVFPFWRGMTYQELEDRRGQVDPSTRSAIAP